MKDCLRKFISIILLIAYSFTAFPVFAITTELRYLNLKDTIYTYGKSTDENLAGRLIKREDSSGNIIYEYGKLGEITKETRTLESFINYIDVGQFVTKEFEYKSNYLGQMGEITYPDGEVVTYSYDDAGQVNAITGVNTLGDVFEYVKKIGYDEYSQRTLIEYGSGVVTEYSYDPQRRWLKTMKSVNSKGEILQNYTYTFDTAGNVTSYINDCLGSSYQTTEQKYTYDTLYQLIKVEGECKYSFQKNNNIDRTDTYTQTFQYDNTGNLTRKITSLSDISRLAWSDLANRDLSYEYNSDYAHRLKKAGSDYYQYDSNGNITAISTTTFDPEYDIQITYIGDDEIHYNWNVVDGTPPIKKRNPSNQRTCLYDDRDQMSEVRDIGVISHTYYHYDEEKIRTSRKIGTKSEVLTFNDFYSILLNSMNRGELGQTQKSIMLGQTRLVSKIDSGARNSTRQWKDEHTFYYLSDHIGTANFITTYEGEIFQVTEYTPYGERWIERSETKSYAYYLPYRFAGKPLDEETGWYYFGARYYDPKYQIWTTSDPALNEYFDNVSSGEGGVYNFINLNTYHYACNNPIVYNDPDGNAANWVIGAIIGFGTSVASEVGSRMHGDNKMSFWGAVKDTFTSGESLAVIGASTAIGALSSGISAATTNAATSTAMAIGKEATKQTIKNTITSASISGTFSLMGAKAKDMTVQAIKGDEYNPDNTIGGMLSSWFSGAFTSGVASGISIKIPYAADAVHTIVEDVIPAYMEMYDSLIKDE